MSIFASLAAPDEDHMDTCAVYVEVEPHVFDLSGKPCDCGTPTAPIVYQGSHVLPADDDPRGGGISLALIPSHVTRDGRDDLPEDGTPRPWLRFGIHSASSPDGYVTGGDATVILDRKQVQEVCDTLTWWLEELA